MAEFKDRLREAMNKEGLKQVDLSRKTGISAPTISEWLKGSYLAKQDKVAILAKALNVSPSWLMGLDDTETEPLPPDCFPIQKKTFPLLGDIACGEPLLIDEHIEAYVTASDNIHADFCIRAHGDSMIGARIHDGDIIFIRKQPIVENGQIAAVRVEDIDGDRATLKRVYYDQNTGIIQLVAENPLYPTKVYSGEQLNAVEIIGLAVAFQSVIK